MICWILPKITMEVKDFTERFQEIPSSSLYSTMESFNISLDYSDYFADENFSSIRNMTNSWNSSFIEELNSSSNIQDLPLDMQFNTGHVLLISCYSCILAVSLVGNLCVLSAIMGGGRKQWKSRVNLMLLHLAIADLIVSIIFTIHLHLYLHLHVLLFIWTILVSACNTCYIILYCRFIVCISTMFLLS